MKRYNLYSAGGTGGDHWLDEELDPEGEWVKFEDIGLTTAKVREKFGSGFVMTDRQYIDFLETIVRENDKVKS